MMEMKAFSDVTLKWLKIAGMIGALVFAYFLAESTLASRKYTDAEILEHEQDEHVEVKASLAVLSGKIEDLGKEQAAQSAQTNTDMKWIQETLYRGRATSPPPNNNGR